MLNNLFVIPTFTVTNTLHDINPRIEPKQLNSQKYIYVGQPIKVLSIFQRYFLCFTKPIQ